LIVAGGHLFLELRSSASGNQLRRYTTRRLSVTLDVMDYSGLGFGRL